MYNLADHLNPLTELGIEIKIWTSNTDKKYSKKETFSWLRSSGIEPLKPEKDGFIGQTNYSSSFLLLVSMPNVKDLRAVTVVGDSKQEIQSLANYSDDIKTFEALKVVPVYKVTDGFSTKQHNNSLRVVTTRNNCFQMFEIGIATRIHDGKSYHFLAVQKLYEARLYLDSVSGIAMADNIAYPGYQRWQALQDLVNEMVDLSSLPSSLDPLPLKTNRNKSGIGRVIFFNPVVGWGLIEKNDGRAGTFHWTKIVTKERFPFIEAGQPVNIAGEHTSFRGTQFLGITPAV